MFPFFATRNRYILRDAALGGLTGVVAAYSVRKVVPSYRGALVRIRRNQDSAETDIGYAADGSINVSDINTFLAGSSPASTTAFITTWYDQSGNGNNLTQSTAAKQAVFTASGIGGKPSLDFQNAQTYVAPSGVYLLPNGPNTAYHVCVDDGGAGTFDYVGLYLSEAGAGRYYSRYDLVNGEWEFLSRATDASPVALTGVTITTAGGFTSRRSGTTQAASLNGGAETTNASASDEASVDAAHFCSRRDVDSYFDGKISEAIYFNVSHDDTTRTEITNNQKAFYGIS